MYENIKMGMFTTDMDGGVFWRSLEKFKGGDIIEHNDKRWKVQYCWEWITGIFISELEPVELDPRDSREYEKTTPQTSRVHRKPNLPT